MIKSFNYTISFLACLLTGFFSIDGFSQDQTIADSLIGIVDSRNVFNDSTRCYLFNEIAFYSTSPDERIFYGKKAVWLAEQIQDERQLASGYRYIGNGKKSKGDLSEAIGFYLLAANSYSKIGLRLGVGVSYLDIGVVYLLQNNFANSKNYHNQSIEIFRLEQDSMRLASALLNIGDLYRLNGYLDSARYYFEESKSIFEIIQDPSRLSYANGNLGLVFLEIGQYDNAEVNLISAIKTLSSFNDLDPVATYRLALSKLYAIRGEEKKAFEYADIALSIGLKQGLKERIRDASLQLSELYQERKKYEKAYQYQSQYIAYRDSINNEETIRKMADLRTEFEVGQKQVEVDLKQKEVDLLENEAYISRIFIWGVLIAALFLMGIIALLMKLYRLKVKTVRIVRERRRVIEEQKDELDQLNETKDRFFSIISHDLRGPVSNFSGVASLIQMYIQEEDYKELKRIGNILEDSSHELSTLLDNLLDWAMSQQGKFPYKPEEVSVEDICNPNLRVLSNSAKAKRIELTEEMRSEFMLHVDQNSASTMIRNLLSNALKFTPEEGEVTLSVERDKDMAVIKVVDTGIGIPKDKMETLFGFQGSRKRWGTKGEKGVGLGLNLVKEFVELNKGRIEVDSEEGKGTEFRVFLPLFDS